MKYEIVDLMARTFFACAGSDGRENNEHYI